MVEKTLQHLHTGFLHWKVLRHLVPVLLKQMRLVDQLK